MHFSMIASIPLLFLSALTSAAPTPMPVVSESQTTTQIYYLVNCFNNANNTAYAEIAYYPNKSLSLAGQAPTQTSVLDPSDSIQYEDGTWVAATPFKATIAISANAYTLTAGHIVGSATVSTSEKALKCYRLARFVLYQPKGDQCYTDYACQVSLTLSSTTQ
ncbi:hypothetical protein DSL72_000482 [Monilinia vaccinii-corymbosi]|uniref:Uncharacterized protein n=1 Tax=Monilinia vaccinii-corymbosi TaxID=61207 RepID=A0A8A3P4D1_9HELO|nr:hypothetical protein DSL72_000482 [Monilinia vaccinii-corymbosi]